MNRCIGRLRLFDKRADYLAFEEILHQTHERTGIRIAAYCVMPNHWHLLLAFGQAMRREIEDDAVQPRKMRPIGAVVADLARALKVAPEMLRAASHGWDISRKRTQAVLRVGAALRVQGQ
ncbi:MAG: transposase [Candidatus Binatia bacterium]